MALDIGQAWSVGPGFLRGLRRSSRRGRAICIKTWRERGVWVLGGASTAPDMIKTNRRRRQSDLAQASVKRCDAGLTAGAYWLSLNHDPYKITQLNIICVHCHAQESESHSLVA